MASRQDGPSFSSRRLNGRAIGQFVIDKEIGKGSFAQVYVGWHKDSKAAVAVKSVELERLNKKLKENLYGEIQILKTLRHPHIVALHDCLESSTHINLIMEYCELGDLSLFIKKRDKLSTHPATHDMARKYPSAPNSGLHEVVIRHFLKQLASALEFLRSKNYVHRDVKPQNLLLLPSQAFRAQRALPIMSASHDSLIPVAGLASLPMLKLADFGFARVLPSTSLADTLCGSPLYMAPEILRYERYDAKADLWSVGTVLYEMMTGRPPFRARNHVELLRKIEASEDVIKFPREVVISAEMKALVRNLLKRSPVERLSFENFFSHPTVTGEIPGLVEDDIPKPPKRELQPIPQGEEYPPSSRAPSARHLGSDNPREQVASQSPREAAPRSPPQGNHGDSPTRRQSTDLQQPGNSPRDAGAGLGIHRPSLQHASSSPNQPRVSDRSSREQPTSRSNPSHESSPRVLRQSSNGKKITEEEKAAQDVMFERDYVVVERRHVEVNALADELAANERLSGQGSDPRSAQMVRRSTQQGAPTSTTGAIPAPSSRTALVAQGRTVHDRRSSYEKALSASPGSASSAISKAIQDASLRLFGFKVAPVRGKGHSPPMYQPFPAYPTPSSPGGLIGDGKSSPSADEDARTKDAMTEYAERSDCVYGFAEVKFKQLVPMAPSMDHGLGGVGIDQLSQDEDGLTIEAVVALSEEALVLYVKSLTLLARAMDLASVWWSKKGRGDGGGGVSAAATDNIAQSINAIVQWVRQRFNEVLEKSEIVRFKLMEGQKMLPEDHPSYPSNQGADSLISSSGSTAKQVYLTPGISAEKLMYDRALEMSRAAAIDEVTNDNLPGCKISYRTAIRMLEAVLDNDDDEVSRRLSSGKEPTRSLPKEAGSELDSDEEAHVRKMIQMIKGRLAAVVKKQQMIADANTKEQQAQVQAARRRSGDATPRSVPSHGSA
ncbi:Serine/threonine-protein kinase [Metarhizium acridum CQMa 102]|uniref:non-specific serine/threonine protein kinase n=1 Tax=Metarhizium acridum (strain CQMa 102) TaxID=655827 RepID=E9E5C2_METAQ|nr:Serine/threonine-protein kinase [Metarhizium acridum CQMa 102]EFY88904.1 Serine/threonine-protein kinase [Metarhizium acridum CQMa 102]